MLIPLKPADRAQEKCPVLYFDATVQLASYKALGLINQSFSIKKQEGELSSLVGFPVCQALRLCWPN